MSKYYFGIDLGTTNSAISFIDDERKVPQIIKVEGLPTVPSCVQLLNDGTYAVGREAYENRDKESAIYSVKRYMGTNKKIELVSDNGEHKVSLTPEEVSAKIIRHIIDEAEKTVGRNIIKEIVITVPAYFNNNQRRATKKAGELAGVKVAKIINEPTSASLAYGVEEADTSETIMIYDLGGGTFDVTILDVIKGIDSNDFDLLGLTGVSEGVNIIYSDGDTHLGGDDLDDILLNMVINKFKAEYDIDIKPEEKELYKLKVEKVKKQGTGNVFLNDDMDKRVVITYDDMEQATRIIYNKTKDIILRCIKACGGSIDFTKIVFVGGSTKNRYIKEFIKEDFPNTEILDTYKPDESVALGASVQALASEAGHIAINDVVPLSIGIRTKEGNKDLMSKILIHGNSLPCSRMVEYKVNDNQQGKIKVDVYQGDGRFIEENTFIGSLIFNLPTDVEKVAVKFQADLNGLLMCSLLTPYGMETLELANIFTIETTKESEQKNTLTDSIEDKIQRKKYVRLRNVIKRYDGTDKDLYDFDEAFKQGKGQEFVKEFKQRNMSNTINTGLDRIGD